MARLKRFVEKFSIRFDKKNGKKIIQLAKKAKVSPTEWLRNQVIKHLPK